MKSTIGDYIDCITLATAIALEDDLLTEDRNIHAWKDYVYEEYGVKVYRYSDLAKP